MEKILDAIRNGDGVYFIDEGRGRSMNDNDLAKKLKEGCNKISTSEDLVIVAIQKTEYEKILKEKDSHKRYQEMLRQYDKK